MIVLPAIDLREGACVQLVQGRYDEERIRLADPVLVARHWAAAGLTRLHVVDLDAATGRGSNAAVVRAILTEPGLDVQVGGGVRSIEAIRRLLELGALRVIVGTRAIEDPEWLAQVAGEFPGRLIVAADVAGRIVLTRGWTQKTGRDVLEVVTSASGLPLAGLLVTAVEREGGLAGTDLALMSELAAASPLPLLASGGIHTADEIRALEDRGVHGVILGMALYTGAIDPRALVEEFVA